MIKEPIPQAQQETQTEAEVSAENEDSEYKRKGKKKLKKIPTEPSRDSTPSPLRRAMKEATENKLRKETWLRR